MHLVATSDVTATPPRWARGAPVAAAPAPARAIAIALARTTVIVIESRAAAGDARLRHVGMVRLLAGDDGVVLARRRLATSASAGDALASHLLDEVRASVTAAPHLAVGLVHDPGDDTWAAFVAGVAALAREGVIGGWIEAIDHGALRARLERTLCVIVPPALAREDRLDAWDACLDAWDDAIDGVASFLIRHFADEAQLCALTEHQFRVYYAALRRRLR